MKYGNEYFCSQQIRPIKTIYEETKETENNQDFNINNNENKKLEEENKNASKE
ncbi:hypothetical protein [Brachyspira hyodysenteriae]|uniref:hypothetical protein n=1 Tax=Brachyspira hyodysenteriae TaxID=159 RepID=UPI0030B9C1A4